MRLVILDDEKPILTHEEFLCRKHPDITDIKCFTSSLECIEYLKSNEVDIAILDISMPDINGLVMAAKIKEISPDTSVIFATGYSEFALDAFKVHASGYIVKPVEMEKLFEEIDYAIANKDRQTKEDESQSHIVIHTFGNFDIFVDGKAVLFSRSKSKELLAYLVDRGGEGVSRANAFFVLWEEKDYDRAAQKQFDVIVRSLKQTLAQYGIEDLIMIQGGQMRIDQTKVNCDLYRYMKGDMKAVNSFRGEYMNSYPWAEITQAYMIRKAESGRS